MSPLRVVLFDIGSTLWSSPAEDEQALAHCYGRGRQAILDALGKAPPVEELIEAVEGYFADWEEIWRTDSSQVTQEPTTVFVETALRNLDLSLPADALAAFTGAILETSVHTARVVPPEAGMPEALTAMHALGLRLGCVSNAFMGAATLHQIMVERSLGQNLEMTISSCEFGYRKPHPSIYQAALDQMKVSAGEVVFVGDRLDADVAGPAVLGMRTVLTQQYRQEDPKQASVQPDYVIAHLSDLVGYVEGLLKSDTSRP
jgi:putative hydrolase of the HAD superfamily